MQREYKFRYGYSEGKNWIFHIFTLDQIENGEPYEVLSDNPLLKNYKLVTRDEFTGLTDKNGKEIYEGDIVKTYSVDDGELIELVVFKDGKFITKHPLKLNSDISDFKKDYIEVIGEIHSNLELIKDHSNQ